MKRFNIITVFASIVIFACSTMQAEDAAREPLPCLNKKFSIVAHIVVDSLGQIGTSPMEIDAAIDGLNDAFSDICASFEVCEVRYINNFQYDTLIIAEEWEQAIVSYHVSNRINMFFIENLDFDPEKCGEATLGGIASMHDGGILISNSCVTDDITIIHEMGHYFGLLHTFEGSGAELADGSNCETAGDLICDTPGDPFIEGAYVYDFITEDCQFIYAGLDANGEYYSPHVGNFMSYYTGCECQFSYEQYQRMANTYLASNPKMW